MSLTAKGRLAGVIGWPVGHSRSPQLHGHWLARYRIDGAYVPMAVAPERLEAALRGLAALGYRGCNVTVPHKEAAMALVDELDPLARRIAAVNTIVVREDGSLFGTNTDGFGFLANLQAGAPAWSAGAGPAVVIGVLAPAGTPRAIVDKLNRELVRIVRLPDIQDKLRQMSAEPVGNTPEQFDAFVKAEIAKWGKVIRTLNLKID